MAITYKVKINDYGTKFYYNEQDRLHREDGPAVEFANGSKWWYINDKRHREDGPAIEYTDGIKYWYINGKKHREDGPAIEGANGYKEWWIDDQELSEEEFNNYNKSSLPKTATVTITPVKTITLPIYDIVLHEFENGSLVLKTNLKHVDSDDEDDEIEYMAAADAIESMIMSMYSAGIDITDQKVINALEATVDAISNNFL